MQSIKCLGVALLHSPDHGIFVVQIKLMHHKIQNWLRDRVELQAFGVCQYLGEKMGVSPAMVRMYFIYISFATLGSPLLVYFFGAFWVNIRTYLRRGRDLINS